MTTSLDRFLDLWPPQSASGPGRSARPSPEARAVAGPPTTPAMRRAEETTRIAREATDAATERRVAQVAKLKAARLEKEAAAAAAAPPPKAGRKKA